MTPFLRPLAPFGAAALLVTGIALLTATESVSAAPGKGNDHTQRVDADKTVDARRAPFFGLRVNSMDVSGAARTLACLEYSCPGLLPNEEAHKYQLVRHGYRDADVRPLDCDEILPVAFAGHDVRYEAAARTTRWMRMDGPSGTPVGGFVGDLWLNAFVDIEKDGVVRTVKIPFLDFDLIGTTGMRPGRSTTADDPEAVRDRCDTPLHDEGFYRGRFHRKGLRKIEKLVRPDSAAHVRVLRKLAGSVIAGTFEGRHRVDPEPGTTPDYCDVAHTTWWFDGLLGHRCRPGPVDERVRDTREARPDRFAGLTD